MSQEQETRRPLYLGRRLISIGFVLTGGVLAGTAMFMVWIFGEGLGATLYQQYAYAVAHLALHVFGMLVAFTIGIFIIDRSGGWAIAVAVIALIVGAYGISNIIGFAAKNRISISDAVRENDKRAIQRYEAARSDLSAKRDWAAGQSMTFDHSRYERLQFKKQEREYQKMLDELRMPQVTAATVNADASASVFSRLIGSTDEDWQVRFAAVIGILMFMGEFFSFILAGRVWPSEATVSALAGRKISGSPEGSGGKVKSTDDSKDKQPAREAEIHRFPVKATAEPDQLHAPYKVSNGLPRVPAPAPRSPLSLSLEPEFSSVADFLARYPSVTNQKVIAERMGVSQAKVSRDLKKLKGQGKVKVKRNWRSNAVTFMPRRNGGLHAVI